MLMSCCIELRSPKCQWSVATQVKTDLICIGYIQIDTQQFTKCFEYFGGFSATTFAVSGH